MNAERLEALRKAREVDLLTYLQIYEPWELVRLGPDTYSTRTHGSLKISNGKWFWWAKGIGGHSALDYLVNVKEVDKWDAVTVLTGRRFDILPPARAAPISVAKPEKKLAPIELSPDCTHVLSYLEGRGIDPDIVRDLVGSGRIAEEAKTGYALFFGLDKEGVPKQCSVRATDGSKLKKEIYGSDKSYCFGIGPGKGRLWVFECAIDLLSFATLRKESGLDYKAENMISLSGVASPHRDSDGMNIPASLHRYLKEHPDVGEVVLCLDNDAAGIGAAKQICRALEGNKKVKSVLPLFRKDWNEYLEWKEAKEDRGKERTILNEARDYRT